MRERDTAGPLPHAVRIHEVRYDRVTDPTPSTRLGSSSYDAEYDAALLRKHGYGVGGMAAGRNKGEGEGSGVRGAFEVRLHLCPGGGGGLQVCLAVPVSVCLCVIHGGLVSLCDSWWPGVSV